MRRYAAPRSRGCLNRKTLTAACVDRAGVAVAAFIALDVTRFIAIYARRNAGLFDAEERTVADIIGEIEARKRWLAMQRNSALSSAIDMLKRKQTDVVVGTDPATGKSIGTIQRAHRRY